MHWPVRHGHLRISQRLYRILYAYQQKSGGEATMKKSLIKLSRNAYEPDNCFFTAQQSSLFTDEHHQYPAPIFVCEILSHDNINRDGVIKKEDYASHGIVR